MVVRVRTLDVEKRVHADDEQLRRLVRGAMEDLLVGVYQAHGRWADNITRHWQPQNKPIFNYDIYREYDTIGIIISLSQSGGHAWQYLDYGTPPHVITPRQKPFMRFKSLTSGYQKSARDQTYLSSTVAGDLRYNRKAQYLGDTVGAFNYVEHPGVEPRSYSEYIHERLQDKQTLAFQAGIFLLGNTGFYYDELVTGSYTYHRNAAADRSIDELDRYLLGVQESAFSVLDLFE